MGGDRSMTGCSIEWMNGLSMRDCETKAEQSRAEQKLLGLKIWILLSLSRTLIHHPCTVPFTQCHSTSLHCTVLYSDSSSTVVDKVVSVNMCVERWTWQDGMDRDM